MQILREIVEQKVAAEELQINKALQEIQNPPSWPAQQAFQISQSPNFYGDHNQSPPSESQNPIPADLVFPEDTFCSALISEDHSANALIPPTPPMDQMELMFDGALPSAAASRYIFSQFEEWNAPFINTPATSPPSSPQICDDKWSLQGETGIASPSPAASSFVADHYYGNQTAVQPSVSCYSLRDYSANSMAMWTSTDAPASSDPYQQSLCESEPTHQWQSQWNTVHDYCAARTPLSQMQLPYEQNPTELYSTSNDILQPIPSTSPTKHPLLPLGQWLQQEAEKKPKIQISLYPDPRTNHALVVTPQEPVTCLLCRATLGCDEHVLGHVRRCWNQCQRCVACDTNFKDSHTFHVHYTKKHTEPKQHPCETKFKCPIEGCGYVTTENYRLTRHSKKHSKERNFVCEDENCKATFKRRDELKKHERLRHSENAFACAVCAKLFGSLQAMRNHEVVHTGNKTHKCVVPGCFKSYYTPGSLYTHMRNKHPGQSM